MGVTEKHKWQRANQPSRICETCGEVFTRTSGSTETHADFRRRRFCSRACLDSRTITRPFRERFEAKIAKTEGEDGCWLWTAAKGRAGYGVIGRSGRSAGNLPAHVASYLLYVGPIPDGLVLDHLCRTPACVNPAHLEPVTAAENSRRGARAKLTAADVAQIRTLVQCGKTQAAVADRFGLHPAHVSRIVNGKRWGEQAKSVPRRRLLPA